jgi:hypothetical protein
VAIDDEQAAYDATRHLLKLGHRRIGLLAGDPASIYVAQPRERGYLRAMTEAKCTPVTATGTFFYQSGAPGVDEPLQQDPGLTAIFAMSDEMGAAVVNELQRRGLRVPEDVCVLGFDNTSTARHVNPPLSTMAQPLEEMGRMAVKSCSAHVTWGRRSCRTGKPKAPRTWRSYSVYLGLALIFAYCLAPFYWMLVSSLRRTADIFDNTLLPAPFSLENYVKVFDGSTMFGQALLNSLIVAGTTTVFALLLGVFAAYAISRLNFRFKSVILGVIIATSIFPGISVVVPLLAAETLA